MRQRSIDIGGLDLAVLEAGRGGAPVMLVHGFTGLKEDFADEVDPLAALGYHVVAPDLRGHGESSRPDDESAYTFEAFADDLFALADALGWNRFDLLGHSMGGMVAQVGVLRAPDRIDRLVLMDTTHTSVSTAAPELVALGVEMARTQGLDAIVDLLTAFENPEDNPAFHRVCAERPGYREWSDRKARSASAAMYAAMLPIMGTAPSRLSELARLANPTLVMVGALDAAFVGPSREIAEAIPGADYVEFAGAGHCPQFEATDVWRSALHGFLGRAADRVGRAR